MSVDDGAQVRATLVIVLSVCISIIISALLLVHLGWPLVSQALTTVRNVFGHIMAGRREPVSYTARLRTQPTVLLLGDSVAMSFGTPSVEETLAAHIHRVSDGWGVYTLARNGATMKTIEGILAAALECADAGSTTVHLVLMSAGGNNVMKQLMMPEDVAAEEAISLVAAVKKLGLPTMWSTWPRFDTIPVFSNTPNVVRAAIKTRGDNLKAHLSKLCAGSNIRVLDPDAHPPQSAHYSPDGLHPNAQGNENLARIFFRWAWAEWMTARPHPVNIGP